MTSTRGEALKYKTSLELALAIVLRLKEDLANEADIRVYTWRKDPGNYYVSIYPASLMDSYVLEDVEEETKLISGKIEDSIHEALIFSKGKGITLGLYSVDNLMIPHWSGGEGTNYFKAYREGKDFEEVYQALVGRLNLEYLKAKGKCLSFDNEGHSEFLQRILDYITVNNCHFELPHWDSAFPFETVLFSDGTVLEEYDL